MNLSEYLRSIPARVSDYLKRVVKNCPCVYQDCPCQDKACLGGACCRESYELSLVWRIKTDERMCPQEGGWLTEWEHEVIREAKAVGQGLSELAVGGEGAGQKTSA